MTTYKVNVEKKKEMHNPTYQTTVKSPKDYPEENEYFLKKNQDPWNR